MIVTFDYDQQIAILAWLQNLYDAEMSLEEVIEGLERGYLTTNVTITDKRHSSFSEQNSDVSRVSEEV